MLAHESFEDELTAKIMNEYFVNIKVRVTGRLHAIGWPISYRWTAKSGRTLTVYI